MSVVQPLQHQAAKALILYHALHSRGVYLPGGPQPDCLWLAAVLSNAACASCQLYSLMTLLLLPVHLPSRSILRGPESPPGPVGVCIQYTSQSAVQLMFEMTATATAANLMAHNISNGRPCWHSANHATVAACQARCCWNRSLPIMLRMTILRIASTLYWLVQEPAVPLKVRASMQMEPPAVTCPATYSRAYCMLPSSSVRLSMHNAVHSSQQCG